MVFEQRTYKNWLRPALRVTSVICCAFVLKIFYETGKGPKFDLCLHAYRKLNASSLQTFIWGTNLSSSRVQICISLGCVMCFCFSTQLAQAANMTLRLTQRTDLTGLCICLYVAAAKHFKLLPLKQPCRC
jgi:hypothetical protein